MAKGVDAGKPSILGIVFVATRLYLVTRWCKRNIPRATLTTRDEDDEKRLYFYSMDVIIWIP